MPGKQFWIYLFDGVATAVAELIDAAFGNNMGIDSICVMSAFTIIAWCGNAFGEYGRYAYEVDQDNMTECCILQFVAATLVMMAYFLFNRQIPHLFALTDIQYELFSRCLLWRAIFTYSKYMSDFLEKYLIFHCENKTLLTANAIYYVCMIGLDALVVAFGLDCPYLAMTTGVSFTIYDIYVLAKTHIWKEFKRPSVKALWVCVKNAYNMLVERVLGKIATAVYSICASHLGTNLYALHSVGYNIATTLELVTDCMYFTQIVELGVIDGYKKMWERKRMLQRRMFFPTMSVCVVLVVLLVTVLHGDTSLGSAFVISMMYASELLSMWVYENNKAYLVTRCDTKSIKRSGYIGLIVRIPIALIGAITPIGIFAFAFGCAIDYFARGLYFRYRCGVLVESGQK